MVKPALPTRTITATRRVPCGIRSTHRLSPSVSGCAPPRVSIPGIVLFLCDDRAASLAAHSGIGVHDDKEDEARDQSGLCAQQQIESNSNGAA